MKPGPLRELFRPLFGLEQRETTSRVLYTILGGGTILVLWTIGWRLLTGATLTNDPTVPFLLALLVIQGLLFFMVRSGYVQQAALALVVVAWAGTTYQAWRADGVRDVALYVYVLIVFVAALVANWQTAIAVCGLSIVSIWVVAIAEARGLRTPTIDLPITIAWDLTAIFAVLLLLLYLVINQVRNSLEAVRAGEEKFRKIFHLSPLSTAIVSQDDGRLIAANEAYWKFTGFDPTSSIGKTTVELGMWPSPEAREAFLSKLKEQKSLHDPACKLQTQAGEYRTTLAFYELMDFEREPAILAMFHDITDQQTAQSALRRSEAQIRALLDAIPDMIFEIKRDGTILQFISSSGSRPLLPPEQFLGKTLHNVLPSVAGQTAFAIERVLESRQVNAFEYQLLIDGETRTYEARLAPLSADTVLAIVRDISLQKWILNERDMLINEMESKNAELERFTYTVSHDLKSPLITIKGFLGFLRQDALSGNMQRLETDLQRIDHAADKMQGLLNDLLELSRIGRLVNEPETIDLNAMVSEVLELLDGRIQSSRARVLVQENLPKLFGDRQRLFEVLQNLIDNAAKFMGDQPDPVVEIGQQGTTETGAPILFVRDNGMGIDPKFTDRIFGLFDKLDPHSDGTGIGLALARRIIEVHGGHIWVESQPGQGATFYFTVAKPQQLSTLE